MFDGIGPFDWLVIGSALALGFGLVKFMLSVSEQKRQEREAAAAPPVPRWFDVLGVRPDDSWDAITAAYDARLAQYAPEKVAGLGPEFIELAERATRELHAAYEEARAALKGTP